MRLIYHPTGSTLSDYALRQWLAAATAAVDAPPAPGVILDTINPDYPWSLEPEYLADDRETQGGKFYSRVRASRLLGTINFSGIHSSDIPAWRACYAATQGFRLPVVLRLPELNIINAVAPAKVFPLALVSLESWSGSLNVVQWL